jgi:hypothetical protein
MRMLRAWETAAKPTMEANEKRILVWYPKQLSVDLEYKTNHESELTGEGD